MFIQCWEITESLCCCVFIRCWEIIKSLCCCVFILCVHTVFIQCWEITESLCCYVFIQCWEITESLCFCVFIKRSEITDCLYCCVSTVRHGFSDLPTLYVVGRSLNPCLTVFIQCWEITESLCCCVFRAMLADECRKSRVADRRTDCRVYCGESIMH